MMLLFFLPLLFLPGRIFAAYCYLPLTGMALAFSGAVEGVRPAWIAVFFLLWTPLDIHVLRQRRNVTLAHDAQVREWVTTAARFASTGTPVDAVVYAGHIPDFANWGYRGALHYLFDNPELEIRDLDENQASKLLQKDRVALMTWNEGLHHLAIRSRAEDVPYIQMDGSEPLWQLGEGWFGLEGDYRWMAPAAVVHLNRPAGSRHFELKVNAGPALLHDVGPVTVTVTLEDRTLSRTFRQEGWQTAVWDLDPAPAGTVRVTLHTSPPYRPASDTRTLGIAVGGLGFTAKER
jgi:hypothetical protein